MTKFNEFEKGLLIDISNITEVDYTTITDARELFGAVLDMMRVIEQLKNTIRELKERPDDEPEDMYETIKLQSLGYDV